MGYAVAGIIVIISGVLAWLSVASWRWFNITLVFLIVCAASTMGFLAAHTLKVHSAWRSRTNEGLLKIAAEEKFKYEKLEGIRDENGTLKAGIRQMKQQVQDLIVARGPAWFDAKPEGINPDGSAEVTIEVPEPHGVSGQSIVFVFESTPVADGGAYLGEFRVSESAAKSIKLQPNLPLTADELKRLRATKGLWNIYLKMPADENEVYVALSDEEAETLLPKDLDASFRKGTRTEEQMSDWVFLFHNYSLERELINDQKAKLQSNIARLEESLGRSKKKIAYRTKEKADLGFDKQGFEAERVAVASYAAELEAKSTKLAAELAEVRAQNARLAAELKALQLKAAERINQRTETAQATP